MILVCPHCGHNLPTPLYDGISACLNCNRVFSSNAYYNLLSAAWMAKKGCYSIEVLQHNFHLTDDESLLIEEHILLECMSLEEFKKKVDSSLSLSSVAL